ncbi:MAG: hypothetical protein KAJ93_08210 [Methanosarcinales archaeon]|nr:hypothetical protein [Methanosarcinales archaeon]
MNFSTYTQNCLSLIDPYLKGEASTCSYCDHLDDLILQEGQHTYITIAIGQIVEGYLQVCSKEHRTAATGLNDNEANEMHQMKKIVRDAYKKVYGNNGIAFEHGKAGSCHWDENQEGNKYDLCYHAHIHFVPVEIDIRYRIKEYIPAEIIINSMEELKDFRTYELGNDSYLYYEDSNEVGYVYPVNDENIPRQFLRSCVAKELNIPDRANWIKYPGSEYFEKTKTKLGPVINSLFKSTF